MPSRSNKSEQPVTPPGGDKIKHPTNEKVKLVQSSPLKIESEKFLKAVGLHKHIKEMDERMAKVDDMKVPTLYITFEADEYAYRAALAFLQEGDNFGGVKDELLMSGFPKNDPGDDLIVMFQMLPRDGAEVPLAATSPLKATKELIQEVGDIPCITRELPKTAGEPQGVVVEFETEEDAQRVAWQYIATDVQEGEKNPLLCIGEKDENLALAFYTVAGA